MLDPHLAHDTRKSTCHPLRHSVMNVVRTIASHRAAEDTSPTTAPQLAPPTPSLLDFGNPAISSTSSPSREDRQNGSHYLLTSLTLFTTHEPCIMCSMALLHSRVKEIFYLVPMAKTGGCGSTTCVPKLDGVNHRYGIGLWKNVQKWAEDSNVQVDEALDA